jgi:putative transcriptional regulator
MMSRHLNHDSLSEQAALYSLGLLDEEQARSFRDHLRSGCDQCAAELKSFEQTAALLPLSAPQVAPPAQLRTKLIQRIEAQRLASPPADRSVDANLTNLHIVRAQQGSWEPSGIDRVSVKQLYVDPMQQTVTMLVRMEAGATYPHHRHAGPEQCLVLEGDIRAGELVLRAGDYQCAAADSIHETTSSENGCLLLIIASQHDELLA